MSPSRVSLPAGVTSFPPVVPVPALLARLVIPLSQPPPTGSLSLSTITDRERERNRESEEVALVYFLLSFYLLRTFSAYDPPLSPYRVPLPFALRGTFPSTHLPPPVAPQSCFISRLWPPFSPHFVLRFSLRSVERPFPVHPLSFYRVASLSLSLSLVPLFFSLKRSSSPSRASRPLFSCLFLYARSLPSPFFFLP